MREGTRIVDGRYVRADNELSRAEKIANLLAGASPADRAGMIQMYQSNPYIGQDILAEGLSLAQGIGVTMQPSRQSQIAALYQKYLGREPDPEGLAFYSNPDFSLQLIEQDIANSAEAKGRAPLDVNALYGSLTDAEAAGLSTARDINADFPITRGGTVYNFLADGSIQVIKPSDATLEGKTLGATLAQYSPTGEVQVAPYFNADYGKQGSGDLIGKAAIATIIGGGLGLPGVGLSAPAAAAAASGATTLGTGGDVEDAAKAALLSGLIATGVETAFPSAAKTAADTAVSLAQAGASEAAIVDALRQSGVNVGTAGSIAADAIGGATAAQIASDYAQTALGTSTAGTGAATGPVVVSGATAPVVSSATGAAAGGAAAGGLLGGATAPTQQVQVDQGLLSQPTQTTAAGGAAGGLLATTQPTQTVDVQAQREARINNLYQTILGRAPDAAGLAFYSNPEFTDAQIEADIRNSAEAQQRQQTAPLFNDEVTAADIRKYDEVFKQQSVPVSGQTAATPTGTTAGTLAGTAVGTAATQTVPVQAAPSPAPSPAPAPVSSVVPGLLTPAAAPQTVPVEDRSFPAQTTAPVIPVIPTQSVNAVPTATANVGQVSGGQGGQGGQGGSVDNRINLSLLDAAAITALMGGINSLLGPGDQAPVVDQAALNKIINAPRPTYSRIPAGGFGPGFMPGGTPGGFYQIAPTGVYNPFATAAPFGAGRFGATAQPITLPGLV